MQCGNESLLILYKGPNDLELAVLRGTFGGCVTPNTPVGVKYYVDQAFRSKMMGALTASMAMYRVALEWILYDQGYTAGMLGRKINDLENDIRNETAPTWAMDFPVEMLSELKNIGNASVHTNNGDISKQSEIDKDAIELVDIVLSELLDVIYERPARKRKNIEKLRDIAEKVDMS